MPILGKKSHRQRINEPELLALFLQFIQEVCGKFKHVILDTPAGVEAKPLKKVNKPYKIRREGSFVNGFRYKGGTYGFDRHEAAKKRNSLHKPN